MNSFYVPLYFLDELTSALRCKIDLISLHSHISFLGKNLRYIPRKNYVGLISGVNPRRRTMFWYPRGWDWSMLYKCGVVALGHDIYTQHMLWTLYKRMLRHTLYNCNTLLSLPITHIVFHFRQKPNSEIPLLYDRKVRGTGKLNFPHFGTDRQNKVTKF